MTIAGVSVKTFSELRALTWVQTASGRALSYLCPDPSAIEIEDIAISLSRLPRFTGSTRFFYSVAQHCLHVSQIVKDVSPDDPAAQLWGLLHDAHEYVTGDLPTPFQNALEVLMPRYGINPVKTIQNRIDQAIAQRFGIDWSEIEAVKPLVKRADLLALATERAQTMTPTRYDWQIDLPEPCEIELVPLGSGHAEWLFRNAFDRYLIAYRTARAQE